MFQELLDSYKIKPNPIIIKNLQANGVIEWVHKTMEEILQTYELDHKEFDKKDHWGDYIAYVAWAI